MKQGVYEMMPEGDSHGFFVSNIFKMKKIVFSSSKFKMSINCLKIILA